MARKYTQDELLLINKARKELLQYDKGRREIDKKQYGIQRLQSRLDPLSSKTATLYPAKVKRREEYQDPKTGKTRFRYRTVIEEVAEPVQTQHNPHGWEDMFAEREAQIWEYKEMIAQNERLSRELEKRIGKVEGVLGDILYYRFIPCLKWEEIARIIHHSTDYAQERGQEALLQYSQKNP